MPPTAAYSTRLDAAVALATDAFRPILRKGSQTPYISHLFSVAALVMEHGGDEDQMIAALLHDYLEDIEGATVAELEAAFGPRVSRLVVALTDTMEHPKPPWRPRKEAHLAHLRGAPAEVKLVSAADKLHNATSILRDHRRIGADVYDHFSATKAETLWHYRSVVAALGTGWAHPILAELREVVRQLHTLEGEPDPFA